MDNKSLLALWKIFYWIALLLVVVGAACGILALVLIFMSDRSQGFEPSQLILPLVCFLFSLIGFFIMKSYKKRIDKAKKGE